MPIISFVASTDDKKPTTKIKTNKFGICFLVTNWCNESNINYLDWTFKDLSSLEVVVHIGIKLIWNKVMELYCNFHGTCMYLMHKLAQYATKNFWLGRICKFAFSEARIYHIYSKLGTAKDRILYVVVEKISWNLKSLVTKI